MGLLDALSGRIYKWNKLRDESRDRLLERSKLWATDQAYEHTKPDFDPSLIYSEIRIDILVYASAFQEAVNIVVLDEHGPMRPFWDVMNQWSHEQFSAFCHAYQAEDAALRFWGRTTAAGVLLEGITAAHGVSRQQHGNWLRCLAAYELGMPTEIAPESIVGQTRYEVLASLFSLNTSPEPDYIQRFDILSRTAAHFAAREREKVNSGFEWWTIFD
jgi:hypothetical protein